MIAKIVANMKEYGIKPFVVKHNGAWYGIDSVLRVSVVGPLPTKAKAQAAWYDYYARAIGITHESQKHLAV